jgi:hypothetical protein
MSDDQERRVLEMAILADANADGPPPSRTAGERISDHLPGVRDTGIRIACGLRIVCQMCQDDVLVQT